jgi:hypothetical protein
VGETVYANAMAEEAIARGIPARVCEGIIAHANLDLGEAVDEGKRGLEAADQAASAIGC